MDSSSTSSASEGGPGPATAWSRTHLRDARASLASYSRASHSLKKQALLEQALLQQGTELSGPPAVKIPRRIVTAAKEDYLEEVKPNASSPAEDSIEARLTESLDYGSLGHHRLMPQLPEREDPLADELGVQTVAVRNPSTGMLVLVPRRHFPGAEVEGVVPATESMPEFVVLRRHVCGMSCPDGCREGGGERKKGKEKAVEVVDAVEGREAMEGVVYAQWADNSGEESAIDSEEEQQMEVSKQEMERDIVEKMGYCTVIERHRAKWASEMGALTDKARMLASHVKQITLNSRQDLKGPFDVDSPTFFIRGKMLIRLDEALDLQERLKKEKAKLARMRIANQRARQAGWDGPELGPETSETVIQWLVDHEDPVAAEMDLSSSESEYSSSEESDDGASGADPSWDQENVGQSTIAHGISPGVIVENFPTNDAEEAMTQRDSYPTFTVSVEAVSDDEDEEGNKLQAPSAIEDIPIETAEQESIAAALIAQTTIARDATSPDATIQETPILEANVHEDTPQEVIRPEATAQETIHNDTSAEEVIIEETAVEGNFATETVSHEIAAGQATAQETASQIVVPLEPSRKRPASRKSYLKRRPSKRRFAQETPFLDASERERPAEWILQRDGRLVRNPLADFHNGPQAGRRWSNPDIEAPVPIPPASPQPRPRALTISEGTALPAPTWATDDMFPSIEEEGQAVVHVEEATRDQAHLQFYEQSAANRASIDDITSLARARGSTPEPPESPPERGRRGASTLAILQEADEEVVVHPEPGFRVTTIQPRPAELQLPYRPKKRPSLLRTETRLVDETSDAEELERGAFASRVPLASRHLGRSGSSADTENPSPVPWRVFSREVSGRSSAETSVPASPTGSGDWAGDLSVAAGLGVVGGNGGGATERGYLPSSPILAMKRRTVDESGIAGGRAGSITAEVAETMRELVVGSEEEMGDGNGVSEGSGVIGASVDAEEVAEHEEIDEDGAPLTRVSSHSS